MLNVIALPPQVTVPLTQLFGSLHCVKNVPSSTKCRSVQQRQKCSVVDSGTPTAKDEASMLSVLKDLGLSEPTPCQVKAIGERLLHLRPPDRPFHCPNVSFIWEAHHTSAYSFFENKHGFPSSFLHQRPRTSSFFGSSTQRRLLFDLQLLQAQQHCRGFKTLRLRSRRLRGASVENESETFGQSLVRGLLRDKTGDGENLESLMKNKHVPDGHHDGFKTGFAEGFLKAQALAQRTQESLRRTRILLLLFVLLGMYGLYKTPFLSVRFRTSTGFGAAVDPIQVKNITFEHVKGVDEAKEELQDVVEFLKNPKKFTVLGGKLPKGVLLVGPPGTGKTLLARAVAGEASVPFYYASGSEFDEMFVGVGASRIRNLFRDAKANAPCVVFIDELDSVGGKRIESPMHPYSRQTINQLLAELDGFKPNEDVIVIGATNFPEALDNALIRPGRFDMQVTVPRPDVKGRLEILQLYISKIKVDPDVNAEVIARGTVGFSGAELENLVNQAALKAAIDNKSMVSFVDLEFAKDKILMGPERRSAEIDMNNKIITAYHEGGHAVVAYYTKHAMPINKATIMPRGPTLGHVSLLPENDRWSETKAQLLAQMDVSMGGRVAEELIFGPENVTTGASSDFESATKIARMMVTRCGMSIKLGMMSYGDGEKLSPETQAIIEQEVRALLWESSERARTILKTHAREHKLLAEALLQYETLNVQEIRLIFEGKALEDRFLEHAPITKAKIISPVTSHLPEGL
uniref:ATP-dependent zinc metalloprotease YME1L1 n=1 Tax=Myxine glutinosa TaxID=7769 RepID=UPI00358FCCEA